MLVSKGLLGLKVIKEILGYKGYKVSKGYKVFKAYRESRGIKVILGFKDLLDQADCKYIVPMMNIWVL
jgi:hypothetical protein